jgi:hypothetical protein
MQVMFQHLRFQKLEKSTTMKEVAVSPLQPNHFMLAIVWTNLLLQLSHIFLQSMNFQLS